ncbi:Putative uncharacterized protein [Lacticaseibacillus paracasei]|nr:Putative uncharacterized protein [Lacticaseibacillus paracasei]
MAAGNKRCFW